MIRWQKKAKIVLLVIGLILSLFGLVMAQFWKDLILERFQREISLEPGSLSYRRWTGTNNPVKSSFYFWNWTNPEQLTNEYIKPHFVEMGPYVFWQFREKINLTYNNENATLTYQNKLYFYFQPELSNGLLSDKVTSINALGAMVAYKTRTWSRFLLYPLSTFLRTSGQKVWWTKTVGELLFEGFENPVQTLSSYIPGFNIPDKFSYLHDFNNTVQPGVLNIDTGKNDLNKIGQIYFLDYKNESDVYPSCKEIKGTNGDFFAPFVTPERKLEHYIPEVCRRVIRYYDGESTYEGLKTYVFSATEETFKDVVSRNKCYCEEGNCHPPGIFDLSRCRRGPPISTSLPHFLYADPYYRNGIDGMNPDEAKHKYYSKLEVITGIQVDISVRVQVNVHLARNPGLSLYRNVPDIYIPIFWQESKNLIQGEYLQAMRSLTFLLKNGSYICYGICGLGLAILSVLAFSLFFAHSDGGKKRKRNIKSKHYKRSKSSRCFAPK